MSVESCHGPRTRERNGPKLGVGRAFQLHVASRKSEVARLCVWQHGGAQARRSAAREATHLRPANPLYVHTCHRARQVRQAARGSRGEGGRRFGGQRGAWALGYRRCIEPPCAVIRPPHLRPFRRPPPNPRHNRGSTSRLPHHRTGGTKALFKSKPSLPFLFYHIGPPERMAFWRYF